MIDEKIIFSAAWMESIERAIRNSKAEDGSPEIVSSYYAAKKTRKGWKISNGRAWWDNPVLVREIHEYPGGMVCAHNYIEGVGTFGRRAIENTGLKAIRPQDLPNIMPIGKIVYFDHCQLDGNGRAARQACDLPAAKRKEAAE